MKGMISSESYKEFNSYKMLVAGGEGIHSTDYTGFGRITEFKYSAEIGNAFRGDNPIKYLSNFGKIPLFSY
jgi:alpha-amylase